MKYLIHLKNRTSGKGGGRFVARRLDQNTAEAITRRLNILSSCYRYEARPETIPTVVCLCGSTRFGAAFEKAQLEETVAGKIVLSIGCNTKADDELFAEMTPEDRLALKVKLDELHLRKIDLADEVLVLNVDGYIGDSTRSEIYYAVTNRKPVRYLVPLEAARTE